MAKFHFARGSRTPSVRKGARPSASSARSQPDDGVVRAEGEDVAQAQSAADGADPAGCRGPGRRGRARRVCAGGGRRGAWAPPAPVRCGGEPVRDMGRLVPLVVAGPSRGELPTPVDQAVVRRRWRRSGAPRRGTRSTPPTEPGYWCAAPTASVEDFASPVSCPTRELNHCAWLSCAMFSSELIARRGAAWPRGPRPSGRWSRRSGPPRPSGACCAASPTDRW
jgi:hypothetical protein